MTTHDAYISDDGRYRWWLHRHIASPPAKGIACFIMLNPSTADAVIDDPTILRCIDYVRRWGMASLEVVNLFAWRATDPHELREQSVYHDVVGMRLRDGGLAENDAMILEAAGRADVIVCAWGNEGEFMHRDRDVVRLLLSSGHELYALKVNKNGTPAHPLYLRHDAELVPFNPATSVVAGGVL